ncbi:MAG: right-handed parallel beta-helix repeat-containing protein [Candidatus Thorarchaeota archaeon]
MKRKLLTILFVAILSMFFVSPLAIHEESSIDQQVKEIQISDVPDPADYTPHDYVYVYEDAAFSEEGFTGSGTSGDPYVLEGKIINTTQTCVYIMPTTAHFVIRDCYITSPEIGEGIGARFWQTSAGIVEDCYIINKDYGILSNTVDNLVLKNNTVTDCEKGIWLYQCENVFLLNNTISSHGEYGVYEQINVGTVYINNTITDCAQATYLSSSDNCTMINNVIKGNDLGMEIRVTDYANITGNTFVNNEEFGLHLSAANHNFTIRNNTFLNNGLRYRESSYYEIDHVIANNTVNGKPLLLLDGNVSEVLDGFAYGQIILINCDDITIDNGTFIGACGITLYNSDNCKIFNTTLENSSDGIYLYYSNNCEIRDNNITDNSFGCYIKASSSTILTNNAFENCGILIQGSSHLPYNTHTIGTDNTVNGKPVGYFLGTVDGEIAGDFFGQILMIDCTNTAVYNGVYTKTTGGVFVSLSDNCSVVSTTVSENLFGIVSEYSYNTTIMDCTVFDTDDKSMASSYSTGIYLYRSNSSNVIETEVYNIPYYGIALTESRNTSLVNNSIHNIERYGIFASGDCDNVFVSDNIITDTYEAIRISSTDTAFVYNNTITYNENGLRFSSVENGNVVDNIIGWNSGFDAIDYTGTNNLWDDNVSIGNAWGSYTGSGNISIEGDSESFDRYPRKADLLTPIISSPDDLAIEYGETGITLTWSGSDLHPEDFLVYRDTPSNEIDTGEWVGDDVTVDVNSTLDPGDYTYYCRLRDTCHNEIVDQVTVTIEDSVTPEIDHPVDIEFAHGTEGLNVTWAPTDLFPDSYEISLDSELVSSGEWNGSEVVYLIGDLAVGTYDVIIRVNDTSDNYVTDTVTLTVTSTDTSTDTLPVDDNLTIIMVVAIAGVAVVIVIVVLKKKK